MKKILLLVGLILITGCTPKTERVDVIKGRYGRDGHDGRDGKNGHSLVSQYNESTGIECDEKGGTRLDIYIDLDDSLTVTEGDLFSNSLVACNGLNGLNGTNGVDGAPGLPGVQGPQGVAGTDGTNGQDGSNGTDGQDGVDGTNGQDGATGAQGIPGEQGPQGIAGDVGPQGEVGSQGATGEQGPTGPIGPQGPQGATGAQGVAGSGATIQNYALSSSCTSIGDSLYAKKDGTTVKLFSDSNCSGNHSVNAIAQEESYWLTSTRLGFNDNNGNLRVVKFN